MAAGQLVTLPGLLTSLGYDTATRGKVDHTGALMSVAGQIGEEGTFTSILALAALIQSSVAWLVEEFQPASYLNPYLLKANKWQAARHGLEGRFVDPTNILGDHPMQFRLAAMILKRRVSPYASKLGCESSAAMPMS